MSPGALLVPSEQGTEPQPTRFQPTDRTTSPPAFQTPDEIWMTILESPCTFPPDVFHGIMLNLIKNPNITSSHLFRADLFYDSGDSRDHSSPEFGKNGLVSHLKAEYRPIAAAIPDFDLTRTIVRQLIPRNPQLDKSLVQTCHFFERHIEDEVQNVVLYIPHVQQPEEIPFYHPTVSRLAFFHSWHDKCSGAETSSGTISLSYSLFYGSGLTTKLSRTALRLLQTVHKHGQGCLAGYEKRVHLDTIIPQKRYQDTYVRLKGKYGKQLSEQWVEVTDPGKHVFEDISIAAFLIELWRETYRMPLEERQENGTDGNVRAPFPGFVDIGCGNGILVYILLQEGYSGRGFDARQRKTWTILPDHIQTHLEQRILVPSVFQEILPESKQESSPLWHDGRFSPGTFIISNHADELTPWTPLLAHLNKSAFIAIPCCSHDLSGARFRAPPSTKALKAAPERAVSDTLPRLPQQSPNSHTNVCSREPRENNGQAAETGSLKRTEAQKKMPSAYSSLCSYVMSLAEEIGYAAEKEVLRIPSTRNLCIIGRKGRTLSPEAYDEGRRAAVINLAERELGRPIGDIGREWADRAERLAKKPGSGH